MIVLPLSAQDTVEGGKIKRRNHHFEKGKDAFDREEYSGAISSFSKSLEYDPYFIECYFLRAMAHELDGNYPDALTDYNIVLHIAPEHTEALFGRGMLYYNDGKYDFAENDFLTLLTTPVQETNAIFFKVSNYESGVSGVMTMEKKDAEILNYLGLTRTRLKKYNEALENFNQALTYNSSDPNYYVNRALLYEEQNQIELAKQDLNQALVVDPKNDLATYNLLRLSEGQESIALYSELIDKDPDFAEPYAERGLAKFNSGDYRGALQDYNKAIEIDTGNEDVYLNRGIIREKLLDLNGALGDYTRAINLDPQYGKAYFNRANVYNKKNAFDQALQDYEQALLLGYVTSGVYYNRGIAHYNSGYTRKGCEDVTKAYEMGMTSALRAVKRMCVQ